jgi:signal transduction histidine kinase
VHPPQTSKAYVTLALIHGDRSAYDSASFCFQEAEKIARNYPDNKNLWSLLYNGLGLYHKKRGDNEKSLEYFVLVDGLGEAGMGKENLAGNQLNIANTYNRMGNRREAIKYLYKALSLFESIRHTKGMSYCYNNLGVLLKQQANLDDAEIYLKKSLELKEQEGDTKGIANSCNELALLYMEKQEMDNAILHVDRTIKLSEQLGSQELLATALLNKGKILRIQGKLDGAGEQFQSAKPLTETLPNRYLLAALQTETGKLHYEKKNNDQAIASLLLGIDAAQKSSNVEVQLNAHLFLSQAYAANNQYMEALDHFQKYHLLEDSISGTKLKLDYKVLETQYEVEKKNAEIALLKKDQELQARTVERQRAIQLGIGIAFISVIVASFALINRYRVVNKTKRQLEIERVRNTIARDLHDDIGSTMSSINIVSQMALHKREGNGAAEGHFKKIVAHSSDIMERMSDIVWSINPANDSLQMTVSKMKEFAAEILEPADISYRFHGMESLNGKLLEVEQRKNIFLIFKETINNAAKYSGATSVEITLSQHRKNLKMEVTDNGKGFDPALCRKGNGLRNIAARAKGINAALHVQSKPGEGTSISLEIPFT